MGAAQQASAAGRGARIRPLERAAEAPFCARLMSTSDPWITLGRPYEAGLRILLDPTREVYVYEQDERIRGFIILVLTGAFIGYIQTVCVAPEARGEGIGTRLVQFAETRTAAVAPTIFLTVSSFNARARALYERLGYTVIGELRDYLVEGHSEVLMWKRNSTWKDFVPTSAPPM